MADYRQNSYVVKISSIAALGGLMFGFDIAIISGTVPYIKEYFRLNDLQLGWAVSSLLMGCIPGAIFSGKLADRLGRKKMLLVIAALFGLTSLLTSIATSFTVFCAARILGGFAVGATSVISPLYIAEISPPAVRGKLVSLNQLALTIGIFLSYFVNFLLHDVGNNNWRWMFASGVLPAGLFFALLFLVPESPRWLLKKGRKDTATGILARMNLTLGENMNMEGNTGHDKGGIKLLFSAAYIRPAVIGIVLAVFVQISGINTIIDYAPIILRAAGNPMDQALFQTFVIGLINFALTFVAIFTIDKFGRKRLYIIGATGMTIALSLLGLGFFYHFAEGLIGLVLIIIFIGFFAACIGPVFWVLMSELFPEPIRAVAISVAVFTNWITNFIVVLFFPYALDRVGGSTTFFFLSAMALLMLVFTIRYLPETKGKSLEEIDEQWNKIR